MRALRISLTLMIVTCIFLGKMAVEEMSRFTVSDVVASDRYENMQTDERLGAALDDLTGFSTTFADAVGATDVAEERLAEKWGLDDEPRRAPEAKWSSSIRRAFFWFLLQWDHWRVLGIGLVFGLPFVLMIVAELGMFGKRVHASHALTWALHAGSARSMDVLNYGNIALTLALGLNAWTHLPVELVGAALLWLLGSSLVLLQIDQNAPVWNTCLMRLIVTACSIVACLVFAWVDPLAGWR